LLTDGPTRTLFGTNARNHALSEWDYSTQAERLTHFYETLLQLGKRQ
jgi:hypothetical protein